MNSLLLPLQSAQLSKAGMGNLYRSPRLQLVHHCAAGEAYGFRTGSLLSTQPSFLFQNYTIYWESE